MRPRVLVVDADPSVPRIIASALADRDVDLCCAVNHDQAVRRFLETGPDLLLIDVMAPPRGGLPLLERIRGLKGGRDVPVFLLSVLSQDADVRREGVGKLRARDLLRKPLRVEVVRDRLAGVLDRPPEKDAPSPPPFAPPDGLEQGNFESVVSPLLLRGLALRRATGRLFLKTHEKKKVLFLREGSITFALSSDLQETLGRHLVAQGKIDEDVLRAGQEAMQREHKKLGEFLVEQRLLGLQEVLESVRQNVLEKVLEIFTWGTGEFRLSTYREPPAPLPGRTLEVSQVLWDGLKGPFPRERLLASLEPYSEQFLTNLRDLGSLGQEVPLGSEELRALRRLRALAGRPIAEVLSEVREDRQVRLLYYLLVQGYMALDGNEGSFGQTRRPSRAQRLREARLRRDALRGKNHFQVLGVPLDASDEAVRHAYLQLVREVHPDALGADAAGQLQHVHEEIFRLVRSAYEAIQTEPQRREYLQVLLGERQPESGRDGADILRAEERFREGEALARFRDWPRAAEAFRQAWELNPDEGEYALHLGIALLAMSGTGREDPVREAEELFETARRLVPSSPEPHYRLGRLALRRGDTEAASAHFRAALERNPKHLGATRELRLINMRAGKKEKTLPLRFARKKAVG